MTLPDIFINRMRLLLGDKTYSEFEQSFSEIPPVSIRYNPNKWQKEKNGVKVPWCESGYYLPSRPTFTFDPSFHAGTYYVQEASSMFLEQFLNTYIKHPVVALDLCAAPGGKSTLTISKLPAGSVLVANEIIKLRSQKLAENIIKWGNPNVIVTNNQASDFSYLNEFFDLIICDVPCSGEGMFRKDAQAIEEWSSNNVDICQNRQREIINDIWRSLKPGGLLVYSTCTYNTLENEENIEWIVKTFGAEVLPCSPVEKWNITGNMCGTGHEVYRF
ncbi:MAG: RsmB/NOP family class I SAM-dependent RNA methyltransferase, partial [Bacteroidaceae bacterium]|nr:RsmB/NOP family class I SAM-dependent RNA methyltransferase [Bacteroidaceae bacterium]